MSQSAPQVGNAKGYRLYRPSGAGTASYQDKDQRQRHEPQ